LIPRPTASAHCQNKRRGINVVDDNQAPPRSLTDFSFLRIMTSAPPTVARVSSVAQWTNLFHPQDGLFRLPRTAGASIEHLDIDLRFVDHEPVIRTGASTSSSVEPTSAEIYLPNVAVITLRGAEHVHDNDGRMDALTEVLLAIRPIEVRW